jgi:hypothetical protein
LIAIATRHNQKLERENYNLSKTHDILIYAFKANLVQLKKKISAHFNNLSLQLTYVKEANQCKHERTNRSISGIPSSKFFFTTVYFHHKEKGRIPRPKGPYGYHKLDYTPDPNSEVHAIGLITSDKQRKHYQTL